MKSLITNPIVSRVFLGGMLALILSTAGWLAQDNAPVPQPADPPAKDTSMKNTATFAAGCFWGVETAFRKVPGVTKTTVGYTGGHTKDPTYKQVCTDLTGHAEAVEVEYDPKKVSYAELLDAFWTAHDPTTKDSQGPDFGTQYRSGIFFHDAEQEKVARASLKEVDASKIFAHPIVTEITAATKFYPAEDYHQQYFAKQGSEAHCHVGPATVKTKLAAEAAESRKKESASAIPVSKLSPMCDINGKSCSADYWASIDEAAIKSKLTPEQYAVARNAGTEQAFTGKYWNEHREGTYKCAVCGQLLFDSATKFESGTGWPSFFQPIEKTAVVEKTDTAYGMKRTEVLCSRCQSHLGHVFDDGPKPSGLRYCMNSAVLDFTPKK